MMTPSRYDTLPIPETFKPIIAMVEKLIHPAWMQEIKRKKAVHNNVRVWALYTSGIMTQTEIAGYLTVTISRVQQLVTQTQLALERIVIPESIAHAIEEHLGAAREDDVLVDDRIHATHMIVSREDHDAIERVEDGDENCFRVQDWHRRRRGGHRWNGIETNNPRFGHANEARLQKQWYDRIQKAYWYEPGAKMVYERV